MVTDREVQARKRADYLALFEGRFKPRMRYNGYRWCCWGVGHVAYAATARRAYQLFMWDFQRALK